MCVVKVKQPVVIMGFYLEDGCVVEPTKHSGSNEWYRGLELEEH